MEGVGTFRVLGIKKTDLCRRNQTLIFYFGQDDSDQGWMTAGRRAAVEDEQSKRTSVLCNYGQEDTDQG